VQDANTLEFEADDLDGRQELAAARRRRESERQAVLEQFVDAKRRVDDLRRWIDDCAAADGAQPELQRMREWAKARLREQEHFLDLDRLSKMLRQCDLFPEIDPLNDPLGEPPRPRPRGRPGPRTHGRRPNIV
jgi:hypothetical protein